MQKGKVECVYGVGEIVYFIRSRFVSPRQKFSFVCVGADGLARVRYVKKDGSLGATWKTPITNLCIGWAF